MKNYFLSLLFISLITTTIKAQTLYSRSSGDWSATNTWATTGHSGPSCLCIPTNLDDVIISGHDVTVNINADCKGLDILTGSSLTVNDGLGLDINAGTVQVRNGGTLTHSGTGSSAHMDFESGTNALMVESGALFDIDDINIAGTSEVTFSGAGNVTLTDDILYNGTNSSLTNNLSGDLNLTGPSLSSLWFTTSSSGCTFINNGTVNCDRFVVVDGPNTIITNNGTMNVTNASFGILLSTGNATGTVITNTATGVINVAGNFNVSNNQMTFNNSGVLDLEGNLTSWSSTAPSEFHNLSGSAFNFAGTGQFFGDFYADYDANTVVLDNTTTLQNELINPEDNFWHLTYSGFQKQIKSDITCKGNFTINVNAIITTARTITMDNGGTLTIASGGSLTKSSGSGALAFADNFTYNVVVEDVANGFDWDFIRIDNGTIVNISGAGTISLEDNFIMEGNNSTVNNNLTGSFTIDKNMFSATGTSGNTFINNNTIDISANLSLRGTSNTFTNNGQIDVLGDLFFFGTMCNLNNTSGAMLTIGDDLLFSGSTNSKLTNDGTMNINGAGTGKGIQFSSSNDEIENSGTMTTLGQLRVITNTNDDNSFVNKSGGILNVASDFQLNDADFIFDNSGTFNLTGRFDDFGGVESVFNRAGGVINYSGIHNSTLNSEISLFTNFDANTFNYNRSNGATQQIIAPQDAYWNLSLSGTGTKEAIADLDINGDMNIAGTANFDVNTNNGNLLIGGNWTSISTFDQGTQQVTFDGNTDQSINTTGGENFFDLIINKSSGTVSLGQDVEVSNTVTLTSGALDLNGNVLSISRQSADAIVRTSGYVITDEVPNASEMLRNIGAAIGTYVFPFGKSDGTYIPLTVELTAGDIGNVTASTYSTGSDNLPWPDVVTNLVGNDGVTDNQDNTVDRFWQIDKSGVSGTADITFTYAQSEVSTNVVALEGELLAQRYSTGNNMWQPSQDGQVMSAVNNTVFVPDVTAFSPWTLALSSAPLPITLTSFEAIRINSEVQLNWTTASEINNDYFTLEKSANGITFTPFGKVNGAGFSAKEIRYFYRDVDSFTGNTYYRIKQTDFDGKFTYSEIVLVQAKALDDKAKITVSPNPAAWDEFTIQLVQDKPDTTLIRIIDANGKEHYRKIINEGEKNTFQPSKYLPSGLYTISALSGNDLSLTRLVIF